ncbi:PhoH family protein [Syntrophobotulus glycolicus DSM 8271]|uniref:PhoH-like protein n=1 Tax=Syntrophobotulus glycolicus (strain DSM 8271 / FlGlyR) TaxID=645991 RepID=F0SVD8_SYNGF|nr:PhoH family protein [Syntrophobotulus glycolicus]ADY56711.1 PhoH family protein [Syntrophobotulus glycolicus DSM 8271]
MQIEVKIPLQDGEEALNLLGFEDVHLRFLEERLNCQIIVRGEEMTVLGEEANARNAESILKELLAMIRKGNQLTIADISYVASRIEEGSEQGIAQSLSRVIATTQRGRPIKAKTLGQASYVKSIEKESIVFGIGPAGTGKTYLAVVMAVKALRAKEVNRIVLTRPVVEAGEKLGFLPGDLQEKVNPYLRPLYDALFDLLGPETTGRYIEKGTIEIAPLAYMRGRTLDDSFIILDEAQNTSPEQMKMFLTRLGFGSKAVVTGDVTQVDLPKGHYSGLIEVQRILKDIPEISFHYFSAGDIVRNTLVQSIIQAYENTDKASATKNNLQ